jgi:hypothetical protein
MVKNKRGGNKKNRFKTGLFYLIRDNGYL